MAAPQSAPQQDPKELKQIEEYLKKSGLNATELANRMNAVRNSAAEFTRELTNAQREAAALSTEWDDVNASIKAALQDLSKSETVSGRITKSFKTLKGLSDKVKYDYEGISKLSKQELESVKKKILQQASSLALDKKALEQELRSKVNINDIAALRAAADQQENKELAEQAKQLIELQGLIKENGELTDDGVNYIQRQIGLVDKRIQQEKDINKTLGITGQVFKGISGAISKIGIDSKYFDDINDDLREAAKSNSQWKVLGAGIKGVFSGIGEALSDPVGKITLLLTLGKKLIDIGLHFNKTAAELGKNYGVSGEAARGLAKEIEHASVASNNLYFNSKNIIEAQQQLNDELGTSAVLSDELTQGQIDLTKKLGLSGEEAAKLSQFSMMTGKSQEKIVYEITKANKGILSNKKLLQEVAKTEGQLAAFYKNDPILIAQAVQKAKQLGMTLEQTKSTTDALLDIESSLANEYEAEMLIGKNIELSKARELALQGKTAEAAEEMLKNVGSISDFQQLNRIQQEALAKSIGTTADDLAKTLTTQDRLSKLTKDQRDKVAELRAAGKDEQADLIEKNAGNDKALKLAEMQVDTQEKLAEAGQKFKDIIASLVAGPIGTLLDGLASGLSVINKIFNAISKIKVPLMIIGGIFGTIWTAAKGIQLAETITAALQGKKLGLYIQESVLRIKGDAQAAVALAREQGGFTMKKLSLALEKESFLTKTTAYALALKDMVVQKAKALFGKEQLVTDQSTLLVQQEQNATEQAGLLVRIRKGLIAAKDFIVQKGILAMEKAQAIWEGVSNNLKKIGLLFDIKSVYKNIAGAAMKVYQSAASIPFVGWILGAAAAAAVVGLGMKLMSKGDDVVSPGYGKRTLMAPEGAIALNDKDTVIAGTDLGGKKKGGGAAEGGGGGASIDIGPLVSAINEVKAAVDAIVNRSVEVYLDSTQIAQKIQTPMAVTARRTG